ncbi:MAG: response regulator [Planctomycetales bacterium]|nr:response regulator [Planctomycetales bacterium]
MAARILVVGDSPALVRALAGALEKKGYAVETAPDGEAGLKAAERDVPDLVITDVEMPKMDGWTLVRRMRATSDFALVPVIILAPVETAEERIQGFRLGADDFLPKPINFEEVALRVSRALTRGKRLTTSIKKQSTKRDTEGREMAALRGTLDQIGLPSVLTILEMERKTGLIAVTRDAPEETGRIFLRQGRVVSARVDGREGLANAEAVFFLLGWTSGRFLFRAREVEGDDEIRCPTPRLLMEGTRRLDESRRLPARKPAD